MQLYLAGADSSGDHVPLIGMDKIGFLCSYFYIKNARGWRVVNYANENNIPVLLDSGAFSAFNIGVEIELQEYIKFCKEHGSKFTNIAYLDAIGNEEKSIENYKIMLDSGIDGIPTYHAGGNIDSFYKLFELWDYIAIGGLVPYLSAHTGQAYRQSVIRLLIKVHSAAKLENKKLHGFGVTTWNLMKSFPWHSVDSSTWIAGRKFGRAMVFDGSKLGSVIAREKPSKVAETLRIIKSTKTASDIIPKRKQGTAAYFDILRMNAEVMYFAVEKLNNAKNKSNSNR